MTVHNYQHVAGYFNVASPVKSINAEVIYS